MVTDLTSAETIKVASNVFLAAKITFANEISRLTAAAGADAGAVVDGMGLDGRIVRHFLSPGPGFGGSCFPSQARALPQLAASYGVQTPLMDAIWPSNVRQADWLLDGLERAAGRSLDGLRVALLGLTFKAGTDDLRESPALRIGAALLARGATVAAFDPVSLEAGTAHPGGGRPRRCAHRSTICGGRLRRCRRGRGRHRMAGVPHARLGGDRTHDGRRRGHRWSSHRGRRCCCCCRPAGGGARCRGHRRSTAACRLTSVSAGAAELLITLPERNVQSVEALIGGPREVTQRLLEFLAAVGP